MAVDIFLCEHDTVSMAAGEGVSVGCDGAKWVVIRNPSKACRRPIRAQKAGNTVNKSTQGKKYGQ